MGMAVGAFVSEAGVPHIPQLPGLDLTMAIAC